jgi:hypothetical protein
VVTISLVLNFFELLLLQRKCITTRRLPVHREDDRTWDKMHQEKLKEMRVNRMTYHESRNNCLKIVLLQIPNERLFPQQQLCQPTNTNKAVNRK